MIEVRDITAAAAGVSTTSDFKLLDISVFSNGITIYFDGTADNYDQIDNITYTKPADPIVKDRDGTPVDSFSHSIPYNNQG